MIEALLLLTHLSLLVILLLAVKRLPANDSSANLGLFSYKRTPDA